MKKQILITIGREYGSGGHDLAALLSQRLGIRMLDRELIDELWKNDPEMQRLAQEYDERPVNRILSRRINEFDNSIPHNVAQRQFDMIRQIADSGESAIFVGRCADYILRDHPLVEADGGVEVVHAGIHGLGKTALPELFCHKIVLFLSTSKNGKAAAGENAPAAVPPATMPVG